MSNAAQLTILDTQLVQCTLVACGTLLVYDYLCTFDQELAYVWMSPAKWSLGTVLFLLNRYLPFIDTFLSLKLKLSMNSPETCKSHFQAVTWLIVFGIIISEIILLLRTYAIWERRRLIFCILCISSALTFIPALAVTELEIRSLKYVSSDLPGCHLQTASSIIIVAYIALAVSETTMAVLTGIKAYRHLHCSHSPWVLQLYREGLLFYLYLLIISLANVLVPILASRVFSNWLATPQRVMHSILTGRVLFLILKQRSTAGMINHLPRQRARAHSYDSGRGGDMTPVFTSFVDEELSTNLTYAFPEGDSAGAASSTLEDTIRASREQKPFTSLDGV